jgi:putative membrane-bound dehydrogenase-like protein
MHPIPRFRVRGLIVAVAITMGTSASARQGPGWQFDRDVDRNALPTVPPGFEVSFFAREPLVRQPCAMAFDARGRLCVGMGPQYRNPKPGTPGDAVVVVLDDDGDGKADRVKTFAGGFNAIQGLAWHGRDLWVANSPDLTVVRDLDGDEVADEYVRVYTDLGNLEHGLHGLNWAPDGKLYMSKGNSKGLTEPGRIAPKPFRELWGVTAPAGTPDFPAPRTFTRDQYQKAYHDPEDDWGREGGVLRCDDGGANLEIVSRGMRNPWDITFDTGFDWIGTDNDQTTGDRVFMPFLGAHFGWNHPWSAHWGTDIHEPSAPVSGPLFEGSGTGVVFGDSPGFPASHRGVFFINDWLRKTTFVWRPRWDGALMRSAGEWEPFVQGGRSLFRPTDIEVGPDGALWILGWGSGYGAEYHDGQMTSEGRVFRVAAWGGERREWRLAKRTRTLPQWTVAELIEDLEGPLPVWRIDAQDELVRRGASVRGELVSLLETPSAGMGTETWVAWALGRMLPSDSSVDAWFVGRLADSSTSLNLRLQAVRILAHRCRGRAGNLSDAVVDLLRSPEPRLRMEAVAALAVAGKAAQASSLLASIAGESDRTVFYAGWQALRRLEEPAALRGRLTDPRPAVRKAALLALLESHALKEGEVRPLVADADSGVKAVAALWLEKAGAGGEKALVRGRPLFRDYPAGIIELGGNTDDGKVGGKGNYLVVLEPLPLSAPATPTGIEAVLAMLNQGDAQRGEWLFHATGGAGCVQCHRLTGSGNAFGPDLATVGDRASTRHLVESILMPNAVITEGFQLQTVVTAEGEQSGILIEESGLSLTLGLANGERRTIQKERVTSRSSASTSAMPAYDTLLSPRHVADLAAYLLQQKSAPTSPPRGGAAAGPDPKDGFHWLELSDRVVVLHGGRRVADFVFGDLRILRPHLANVRAPDGTQVTRAHPPVPGTDATDHDTMHPGLWLAFGDISGVDFWRNKGRMEHVGFVEPPALRQGRLGFTTESRLLTPDGRKLCQLVTRIGFRARTNAWRIDWEATFRADAGDFTFGDQEEMGFGARVATAITEKNGGVVTSSSGLRGAGRTWGQEAEWCDYSGVVGGKPVGITLVPDAGNFRGSWWHNRDYGVFVANPFGRAAMKQGQASVVTVRRGEDFRLRFTAVIHAGDGYQPEEAAREAW